MRGRDLRHRMLDLQVTMNGDRSVSRRYAATLPGLQSRARVASASFRSTAEPTATQRQNHRIATEQLAAVLPRIQKLVDDLTALEQRVEAAGGPTPPGKLPRRK